MIPMDFIKMALIICIKDNETWNGSSYKTESNVVTMESNVA